MSAAGVVAWHLGALHPVEQLLTVLLAFGPFALLGVVVVVRRRQDRRLDRAEAEAETASEVASGAASAQRER